MRTHGAVPFPQSEPKKNRHPRRRLMFARILASRSSRQRMHAGESNGRPIGRPALKFACKEREALRSRRSKCSKARRIRRDATRARYAALDARRFHGDDLGGNDTFDAQSTGTVGTASRAARTSRAPVAWRACVRANCGCFFRRIHRRTRETAIGRAALCRHKRSPTAAGVRREIRADRPTRCHQGRVRRHAQNAQPTMSAKIKHYAPNLWTS
jgi:hypothetical protein